MVLLDACEVAVKQGGVRLEEARNLMRLTLDKTDTALDGMRWGVQKFIRMMDELHLHGVVGLRAANALSKVAKFTKRHMEILQGECQNIYQPRRSFDSTCLRVPNIVYVLFAGRFSRDAIEGGHRLHGQDALGERFTFRVDTFCIFISLDTAFREAQNMAGREVVSLAPLLQHPGLLDFFPKLLDCLKAKLSLVASVSESRGWRVVNMDHWKPQVFRLEPNATLPGSQGHLNAAVLLQECGMVILADHSGKELRITRVERAKMNS
ncbi:hypothetical protein CEP51_015094 [Fusarium floridanum]|uniref:Uncharacterized protein n=1 Tax=Fusarium floridanum TaxID=1325733 RepID=A0A428PGM7_9HYPO|nr:hypothetical protein CEP51_015094 [Fusarium floridanum]